MTADRRAPLRRRCNRAKVVAVLNAMRPLAPLLPSLVGWSNAHRVERGCWHRPLCAVSSAAIGDFADPTRDPTLRGRSGAGRQPSAVRTRNAIFGRERYGSP